MKSSRTSSRSNSRSQWILAGTFTMSVVFAIGTSSSIAATNPPFANPPSGKVIPTFTTVESVEDTIVGKDVRVGNSIKPKTGTNLKLDAEFVNIIKNLSTGGNVDILGSAYSSTPEPANFTSIFPGNYQDIISFPQGKGPLVLENAHIKGGLTIDGDVSLAKDRELNTEQFLSYSAGWDKINNPPRPSVIFQGDVGVANDISASKITAGQIGKFFVESNTYNIAASLLDPKKNIRRYIDLPAPKCPAGTVLVSCSGLLGSSDFEVNPEMDKFRFIGATVWKDQPDICRASATQAQKVTLPLTGALGLSVRATCFDPSSAN